MVRNKYCFLDRDGTINVDHGYVHDPAKLEFMPGAIEGMKQLQDLGYNLVIVTNQSGIGRGYFTDAQYHNFTDYMLSCLKDEGVNISKVFHCPHMPTDNCGCRKPGLGMLEQFLRDNIIESPSYMVGDKLSDIEFGQKLGVETCLIGSTSKQATYSCKSLLEFVRLI